MATATRLTRLHTAGLRYSGLAMLWLVGLWPLLLMAVAAADPAAALQVQLLLELWLERLLLAAAAGAVVLLVFYPPFPAGIRYAVTRTVARLRADRGPLLRARAELRSFESGPRQLEAGRAALGAHDAAAAVEHLQRAVELEPDQPAAWYLLGAARLRLGQPERAIEPLERAVALQPEHAFGSALLLLGRAHLLTGQPAAAARALDRHSREHGGNRKSHFWLGQALRRAGDEATARQAFAVAAAPPPARPRLTAEEAFYRARARTALWGAPAAVPAEPQRPDGPAGGAQ